MAKVAGTASFYINGTQYSLKGSMNVAIGNVERESVVGLDGYHGIKEIPQAGSIECELTDMADLDLNVLEQVSDVTVQVNLINGKSAILRNAAQVNKLSLGAEDGNFTVRFEGPIGQWLTE